MLVPARRHDPEWMDRTDNAPEELEGALHDIGAVNRWLGGSKAMIAAISPFLDACPAGGTLRVLDVGTGGADIPVAMAAEARLRGKRLAVVALDRDPVTAAHARRAVGGNPDVEVVRGDAFELSFADGAFDLVLASMFLHHFQHDDAVRLITEFRRVARQAVIVNDLERHWIPWAFIALGARVTRRHAMFVHDAPLSVLRGFTKAELERIAAEAGADGAVVRDHWPYRLVMTAPS
jgi:SAM-dependent methyltransferase